MVPDVGYGGSMHQKNKVVLDLVEHAHELRNAGVDSFALVRAGMFIACLYAYELGWKPHKLSKLMEHMFNKMIESMNGTFYQNGTDTEQ